MNHTFKVHGMTCAHCEMAVRKAVLRLDPQAKVTVDRAHDKVEVDSAAPRQDLAHVMAEEGYQVT